MISCIVTSNQLLSDQAAGLHSQVGGKRLNRVCDPPPNYSTFVSGTEVL
jgi:hypothetical protein